MLITQENVSCGLLKKMSHVPYSKIFHAHYSRKCSMFINEEEVSCSLVEKMSHAHQSRKRLLLLTQGNFSCSSLKMIHAHYLNMFHAHYSRGCFMFITQENVLCSLLRKIFHAHYSRKMFHAHYSRKRFMLVNEEDV